MGYTMDYFVAALRCPNCGSVSAADDTTNMATYIRNEPQLEYLGVGHPLDIEPETMREKGYITIQSPRQGEAIRILQPWECRSCSRVNWAEIVIRDGIIEDISSVTLNHETLERAHFIHDESKGVAAALTNRSYFDISDEEVVPILKGML